MDIIEKEDGVHMQISDSADFVEGMYIIIKKAFTENKVDIGGLESLADLLTELANRKKEEAGGE